MICSCCGSQYDDFSGVRLFTDRVAYGDGYSDPLTRKERRVLEVLLDRSPMATSEDVFRRLVWQRPFVTDQNVRQQIYRLRLKLAPIGLGIRNLSGVGYVLTIPEPPRPTDCQRSTAGAASAAPAFSGV